jgi:very-short-patch-repair endonuclease
MGKFSEIDLEKSSVFVQGTTPIRDGRRRLIRWADHMRQNMTDQEAELWSRIKDISGLKAQEPLFGKYIGDFCHRKTKSVFEVDGQHHEYYGFSIDCERDAYLNNRGYTVTRFTNSDVEENLDRVVFTIRKTIALKKQEMA